MSRRREKRKRRVLDKGTSAKASVSESGIKPELEEYHSKLTKLDNIIEASGIQKLNLFDLVIIPILAVVASFFTYKYIGTAANWDDLLYLNTALNTTPEAFILNRYAHIYTIKFFLLFTGDIITAGKIYWLFIFYGTMVLTYLCAKLLSRKNGILTGLLAMLFFFIQPVFAKEFGCPLADFSAMFYTMLTIFFFLAFPSEKSRKRFLILIIRGFLIFWTIKSNEKGVCVLVLLLSLGVNRKGSFEVSRYIKDLGWVFVGICTGTIFLIAIDGICMGDAFFSVKPESIQAFLNQNIGAPTDTPRPFFRDKETMSWFAGIAKKPQLTALFVPLVLYIIMGIKYLNTRTFKEKMVWIFPLALLFFLIFANSRFLVTDRYFSSAIPLICVYAALFFSMDWGKELFLGERIIKIHRTAFFVISSVVVVLLAVVFMSKMPELSAYYRFVERYKPLAVYFKTNENVFYAVGIVPFATVVILTTEVLFSKKNILTFMVNTFCLILLVWFPFVNNGGLRQTTSRKSIWRFMPYKVFRDDFKINNDDDVKILISADIHKRSWMLGSSIYRQCWMYNIFFNTDYKKDNFIHGTVEDILMLNFDYALISGWDWNSIRASKKDGEISQRYSLKFQNISNVPIILLEKNRPYRGAPG